MLLEVGGVAMEGTVRFLGEVDGKEGNWGGVELDEAWVGKGKNDGSVKGYVRPSWTCKQSGGELTSAPFAGRNTSPARLSAASSCPSPRLRRNRCPLLHDPPLRPTLPLASPPVLAHRNTSA